MNTKLKRYLNKNYFKKYHHNRYLTKLLLNQKFENDETPFFKKKFIYYPIFWKINHYFFLTISYNAYQNKLLWIKKKFNNIKYHKLIEKIKIKLIKFKIKHKTPYIVKRFFKSRLSTIINFLYLYNHFIYSIYTDLFYLTHFLKKKKNSLFFLILSFRKNKLYINLKNFFKKNYLTLSSGLFIKFFEKKKSFKKNKTIKLLMAKFIRKIFLISKIKHAILIIKKTPVFLMELLNFFNSPIAHKFINPIENRLIEEVNSTSIWIKFPLFIFLENKNFSKNKLPAKGRIKRKILRKIVFENKIID